MVSPAGEQNQVTTWFGPQMQTKEFPSTTSAPALQFSSTTKKMLGWSLKKKKIKYICKARQTNVLSAVYMYLTHVTYED